MLSISKRFLLPDTDGRDAEWIADLLRHGLLKASFIPSSPQRELRDLTRLTGQIDGGEGQRD